ncbi:mitochondrial fission protein ELM1 [Ancylobacter sp. 3268]|uniref:ELM1/GtrOC1 family putative glycosyltransferase n=1 Tax=Ancylobacter sp. 3268 TaxID=2817752 RepID=UPI0028624688|nr:ELM1/GtrOC1 family putative glycosyltransferase [Ancylobacter sp. 3268]MDR6954717.1 mitochondrial fission protein ELM1 [Ancylobacter sp. 3268]
MTRVLVLRDRQPGHFNQAEGLALAVARLAPTDVQRLEIRPAKWARDDLRKLIMRRWGRDARFWLRLMYGVDLASVTRPDIIVASGRPTIAAGLLLSRHFAAPLVVSGGIDGYDAAAIALNIVSSPRQAGDPGAAYAPIPSTVDADAYPPPRRLGDIAALDGASLALLVGGSAYRRDYPPEEWEALLAFVPAVAARYGVKWRVTTSRRTPDEVSDRFKALAASGAVAEFVDYRAAGPGSVRALFGADAVVVTEDSLSMLAEGLAARRPVIGLKSRVVHKHYANEIIAGMAGASLAILPMATVTPERFAATLIRLVPPTDDARDILARALAPVLGLPVPEPRSPA